ncbi:MAG TPA: serine hydrolase, partial [Verrucomicrobiae bacterium]|nr:serine hydrolase [Verrucomicrobiae bacterium]
MISHRRAFLKHLGFGSAGLAWLCAGCDGLGASAPRQASLPRSSPEEQGIASKGILAFLDAVAASNHEFHSLMLLRHGQVVAEGWWAPYRAEAKHMLYSLSKSFTSTAVGLAVAEGKLRVE